MTVVSLPVRAAVLVLAAAMTPTIALAQSAEPTAVEAAGEAYARLNAGQVEAAVDPARRAVAAAPQHLDYRLLLADVLLRSGRAGEAYATLQPVEGLQDGRVQTRLAEAAEKSGRAEEAARAYGAAAALENDPATRAYLTRARIQGLLATRRADVARVEFDDAWRDGVFTGHAPLDTAGLAIAVGDDHAALDAFAEAERTAPLSGRQALDAGYAARRIGRDGDAVRWFSQGLDTLPASDVDFTEQRRFEIRREIETLQRRWGASATISQGSAVTTGAATPGDYDVLQAGGEAYWRVGGYRNGRPLDVFVRAYGVVDADLGVTGGDTIQGWIGARWKPFATTNLVLEGSRMVAIGDLARDDWMLRAAWSAEQGGDLRFDRDHWPAWRLYGDVARIVDDEQTLGAAEARAGWTWRVGDRSLLTPSLGVRAYYDSLLADTTSIGAGPGLTWRHWFRENGQAAPASYFDLTLGYDFRLSGPRDDGLFATLSLYY